MLSKGLSLINKPKIAKWLYSISNLYLEWVFGNLGSISVDELRKKEKFIFDKWQKSPP